MARRDGAPRGRGGLATVLGRFSLRARLLLGLIVVAAVGVVVADVVIYSSTSQYLDNQINGQLSTAVNSLLNAALRQGPGDIGSGYSFSTQTPAGAFGAVVNPTGTVAYSTADRSLLSGPPQLTTADVAAVVTGVSVTEATNELASGNYVAHYFSSNSTSDGGFHYRVAGVPLAYSLTPTGNPIVGAAFVALPENDLDQLLSNLVRVEILVAVGLLVVLGGLGFFVVRVGMRPLVEIESTADAIAAGDLSRRVERADDRTEIGRLGASLNAMLGQIEQAFDARQASENRLRQFLADASHELRTPVTSIRGYAELFRRGATQNPDDLAQSMRRIEDEARRMGVLVDDLLLLARLDQGRPLERGRVDLAEIATDATADAQVRAPDANLNVEIADSVVVTGDEPRLRQVVTNLVTNAIVHTPTGTPITVRVESDGTTARLVVADEGPGIAPEHAARVFERFYRADPSRVRDSGGSGLGLSIVASIAQAHGGSARVDSSPGAGSTFTVELPLAGAPEPAPSTAFDVDDHAGPEREDPVGAQETDRALDPVPSSTTSEDVAGDLERLR